MHGSLEPHSFWDEVQASEFNGFNFKPRTNLNNHNKPFATISAQQHTADVELRTFSSAAGEVKYISLIV